MISDGSPSIIDYQGSLIGPISYDIVSLLKDCYVDLPEHMFSELLRAHYSQLKEMREIDASMTLDDFDVNCWSAWHSGEYPSLPWVFWGHLGRHGTPNKGPMGEKLLRWTPPGLRV